MRFRVVGDPAPQGSKTFYGRGRVVESSKRVKPWREAVQTACAAHRMTPVGHPVSVEVEFYFTRPASHYRTGKHATELRGNAPTYPTSRAVGDIDKLLRSTLDGLTAPHGGFGAFTDDSLVVDVIATKRYAPGNDMPGAFIHVIDAA